MLSQIVDAILHVDTYLQFIVNEYSALTYLLLFLIIFIETGIVIAPFLPGDSLLFAAGALAALGYFKIGILYIIVFVAAVIGDAVNYHIGKYIGPRIFRKKSSFFFNKEYLIKAQTFYEKHGKKTIILARFIPIIRTFAPFVAGIGEMTYKKFISFSLVGGICWIFSFIPLGYFFGNLPYVQRNFKFVILAIMVISVIPAIVGFINERNKSK